MIIVKNFINYYYQLQINDIHLSNGKYFFRYQNQSYLFKPFYGDFSYLETVYDFNQQIVYSNPFYHRIVRNKDRSLVTVIDGKPYVLMKINHLANEPISIFDIKGLDYVQVDKKLEVLNMFHWTNLWESKIDYFEEQIFSKMSEYYSILPTFHYFIGLGENAILYVREALANYQAELSDQLVVSHRRFYKQTTLIDYYDPTELIIDHKARDVAEYIKFLFVSGSYDMDVISNYLAGVDFSLRGASLLFGRLMFPSFYFDQLELCMVSGDFQSLKKLCDRVEEYQLFLADIFYVITRQYPIPEVLWLLKAN